MEEKLLWEKAVAFHGHECGGLTIGFRASLYAAKLLGLTFSKDERLVCIAENDACGVDAVQALLGCSVGKGNLLFHMTGKQAFSFYERTSGKSVRLVLRPAPSGMTREESFCYYQAHTAGELFDVKETRIALPERARLFRSVSCSVCGEETAEHFCRLADGTTFFMMFSSVRVLLGYPTIPGMGNRENGDASQPAGGGSGVGLRRVAGTGNSVRVFGKCDGYVSL